MQGIDTHLQVSMIVWTGGRSAIPAYITSSVNYYHTDDFKHFFTSLDLMVFNTGFLPRLFRIKSPFPVVRSKFAAILTTGSRATRVGNLISTYHSPTTINYDRINHRAIWRTWLFPIVDRLKFSWIIWSISRCDIAGFATMYLPFSWVLVIESDRALSGTESTIDSTAITWQLATSLTSKEWFSEA